VAATLGGFPVMVKAQIHAGGRGKGGGVKLAHSLEEVETLAAEMIGMTLVTHQTGPEGQRLVKKVLVEQGLDIAKELYLSIVPDRASAEIVIMVSEAGGMDIEAVAEQTPEKIIKVHINPLTGIQAYHCLQVAHGLNLESARSNRSSSCSTICTALSGARRLPGGDQSPGRHGRTPCSPWTPRSTSTTTPCSGTKRSPNSGTWMKKTPWRSKPPNTISIISTWTAMWATWSTAPAWPWPPWTSSNWPVRGRPTFLDVGGGANAEMVENGFRIILGDPNVKGILINIFGGILRCDVLAEGVVQAAAKPASAYRWWCAWKAPMWIRVANSGESGLNLISAVDLKDAAAKVAQIVR
jgi:succinyl-CoA synthetase beta subunit